MYWHCVDLRSLGSGYLGDGMGAQTLDPKFRGLNLA